MKPEHSTYIVGISYLISVLCLVISYARLERRLRQKETQMRIELERLRALVFAARWVNIENGMPKTAPGETIEIVVQYLTNRGSVLRCVAKYSDGAFYRFERDNVEMKIKVLSYQYIAQC